jgi:hypothetical protein
VRTIALDKLTRAAETKREFQRECKNLKHVLYTRLEFVVKKPTVSLKCSHFGILRFLSIIYITSEKLGFAHGSTLCPSKMFFFRFAMRKISRFF